MQRRYFKTKKGGAELFEIISSKKKKRTISFRREGWVGLFINSIVYVLA